ncbi:MAG TPA: hypothetical protein VMM36_16060 [Opitutaceae bacterium]|nr:hypothetical protein [Opitutaceae bacterium]
MKSLHWTRSLTTALALAVAVATNAAETTLLLDIDFGVRHVPPSRVAVAAGEKLTVIAPDFGPVQWFKNGSPLAGATDRTLFIQAVAAGDSGSYRAIYTASDMAGRGTQWLQLGVKPSQRLVNLSTRAQVGAGEKTFVAGFVVDGAGSKKIIIRAVGPSLADHGIEEPVAHPTIAIFDKDGVPYENGYVYPACVGCLTYESDLAESLIKAGAFPLPPGTADVVKMMPFTPGAYTVHVNSADGTPGVVLLEIYEVP